MPKKNGYHFQFDWFLHAPNKPEQITKYSSVGTLTAGELFEGCETASSYNDSALALDPRFDLVFSAIRLDRTVLVSGALLLVASAVFVLLETASSSPSDTGSCLICKLNRKRMTNESFCNLVRFSCNHLLLMLIN